MKKYFLKADWQEDATEVTKGQYIEAEANAGFFSDEPGKTATAAFNGRGIEGWTEKGMDLARKYIEYSKNHAPLGATFDDFFDHCNIPADQRSDFVIAAILKQAEELKGEGVNVNQG